MVAPSVDKEGAATRVLAQAKEWLGAVNSDYATGVGLLETIANLLEAGELVPMNDPPSVRALALAEESAANRVELVRLLVFWGEY